MIDTTGSVIYVGDEIIGQLRTLSKIIYFEASHSHVAELFTRDLTEPKPLIWDNKFSMRPGEPPDEARRRCLPELVESRAQRYAKMAHVTIPYEKHKKLDVNIDILFGRGA